MLSFFRDNFHQNLHDTQGVYRQYISNKLFFNLILKTGAIGLKFALSNEVKSRDHQRVFFLKYVVYFRANSIERVADISQLLEILAFSCLSLFLQSSVFFSRVIKILAFSQVNGKDMRNATHQEAVAALIANVSLIKLLVRHDPPPKGLQVSITNLSLVMLVFQSFYMEIYWPKRNVFFSFQRYRFSLFGPKSFSCL